MDKYYIVERLMSLYCFNKYEHRYMYLASNGEARYIDPHTGITHTDLYEHLDGKKTISVYGRKYTTKFMTLDVDEPEPDHVFALISKMKSTGIPEDRIYVSTSGNKGYHIDVFFDESVLKQHVENYYEYIRRDPEIAKVNFECFPLYHSSIKIPLGINFKTGRRCWYIDRTTLEPYENFDYIMQITPMSADEFNGIVRRCNKEAMEQDIEIAKKRQWPHKDIRRSQFSPEGEPVLTAAGDRHILMRKRAVYLRKIGGDEESIYDELLRWVDRQDPSLIKSSPREIERDAANLAKSAVRKYDVIDPVEHVEKKTPGHHITNGDVDIILKAANRNARKVAFLICMYCKQYGSCRMGYERMAETIGISVMTAYSAVGRLIDGGIIRKVAKGRLVRSNNGPLLTPNEYKMAEDAGLDGEEGVEFDVDTIDDFDSFYYSVMVQICGVAKLKKYFTAKEMKLIGGD